jgi:hypothetical protein
MGGDSGCDEVDASHLGFLFPRVCLDHRPRMAAKTRRFAAMSTEPAQPDTAPRPKGFVRRNWWLLLFVCFCLCLSVVGASVRTRSGFLGAVSEGQVVVGRDQIFTAPARTNVRWQFELVKPQFAGLPKWQDKGGLTAFFLPLWLPVGVLSGWIAFREWRRKRAAKGKACSG